MDARERAALRLLDARHALGLVVAEHPACEPSRAEGHDEAYAMSEREQIGDLATQRREAARRGAHGRKRIEDGGSAASSG